MTFCDHWRDCGVHGGGCCNKNYYPTPSLGFCKIICKHREIAGSNVSNAAGTIKKIKKYAAVEAAHALRGPASEADAAARLAICSACEHKKQDGEKMWCSKCGCGKNPRAEIKIKVTLAGAECPIHKWGAVKGTGASVASVAGAVAGVAASIAHAILPPEKSE